MAVPSDVDTVALPTVWSVQSGGPGLDGLDWHKQADWID